MNMGLFFGLLKVAGLFRVDSKDEEEGLDHSYHGGSAYGDTAGVIDFECAPFKPGQCHSAPAFSLPDSGQLACQGHHA